MRSGSIGHVLLHGGSDEAFDRSAVFARRLIETFGARLHVVYTVDEPLSAGGLVAEMPPERLIELHQAMEAEARERLSNLISLEDQERLGVDVVLLFGEPDVELIRYTKEHSIDLAILKEPAESAVDMTRAVLEHAHCSVLVLR
jgi:nucleotide-binding universal stress UspA family protein